MSKYFKKINKRIMGWRKSVSTEIISNPKTYILLSIILFLAFFVRVYRAGALMGFYYDQGRDALRIWEFWHQGKPFLVGPVTGLGGIFLGPLYYYLIAPFYLLGAGNPIYPAVFLAFLSTIAILTLYILGWKMHSRATGIIATSVASFSYYLVLAGRWLSNPTAIMLTSTLLLFSMWEIIEGKNKRWWIVVTILIALSLQLEAASAVFYLPMIIVFATWQRENLPNLKTFLISGFVFLISLLPQIIFNFRHDNIVLDNFRRILFEEKSFNIPFEENLNKKFLYFWNVYNSKIFPGKEIYTKFITLFSLSALILIPCTKRKNALILLIIYLGIPMLGYIFFQGNYGNIYDYYMTGYYLPMILLFSLGLGTLLKYKLGKLIVIIFFTLFLAINGRNIKNTLIAGVDGPTHITLGNELQSVDWILENAENTGISNFNVEIYVPPVIPHSYEYLLLWRGTKKCGSSLCGLIKDGKTSIFYTLYEEDPPHPERLSSWLSQYEKRTIIEEQHKFGGVTVQRRKRI